MVDLVRYFEQDAKDLSIELDSCAVFNPDRV